MRTGKQFEGYPHILSHVMTDVISAYSDNFMFSLHLACDLTHNVEIVSICMHVNVPYHLMDFNEICFDKSICWGM
jgi:hypothetical protein